MAEIIGGLWLSTTVLDSELPFASPLQLSRQMLATRFHMLLLYSESRRVLNAFLYLLHLYTPNIHLPRTHPDTPVIRMTISLRRKKKHLNKQMGMIPFPILSTIDFKLLFSSSRRKQNIPSFSRRNIRHKSILCALNRDLSQQ